MDPVALTRCRDGIGQSLASWARDYLCRPHADLGRPGPVCPYMPRAMRLESVYLALVTGPDATAPRLAARMHRYRRWMAAGPPDPDRALLVALPELAAGEYEPVIEATQRRLKSDFVDEGLMIGEFHPGPPAAPGIRNAAFRPLYAPVPLLAVRRMVAADRPFLEEDPGHRTAYRTRFPESRRRCTT
jgi:hypothetical protein